MSRSILHKWEKSILVIILTLTICLIGLIRPVQAGAACSELSTVGMQYNLHYPVETADSTQTLVFVEPVYDMSVYVGSLIGNSSQNTRPTSVGNFSATLTDGTVVNNVPFSLGFTAVTPSFTSANDVNQASLSVIGGNLFIAADYTDHRQSFGHALLSGVGLPSDVDTGIVSITYDIAATDHPGTYTATIGVEGSTCPDDFDGDDVLDSLDDDDDNDGVDDSDEISNGTHPQDDDSDDDGVLDGADPAPLDACIPTACVEDEEEEPVEEESTEEEEEESEPPAEEEPEEEASPEETNTSATLGVSDPPAGSDTSGSTAGATSNAEALAVTGEQSVTDRMGFVAAISGIAILLAVVTKVSYIGIGDKERVIIQPTLPTDR